MHPLSVADQRQMWNCRRGMRRMRGGYDMRRRGGLRVHRSLLSRRLLQRQHLRLAQGSKHEHLRLWRQCVRKMRERPSLQQRRVQLRRYDLHGLLRQRRLYAIEQRHLWHGRRRMQKVRRKAAMRRPRQMRMQRTNLSRWVLRRERPVPDAERHGVQHRGTGLCAVRRWHRVPRGAMYLRSHDIVQRMLQR